MHYSTRNYSIKSCFIIGCNRYVLGLSLYRFIMKRQNVFDSDKVNIKIFIFHRIYKEYLMNAGNRRYLIYFIYDKKFTWLRTHFCKIECFIINSF